MNTIKDKIRDHINLRDLGGYLSQDGRKIKPGLLYRSGGLYLMNQEELDYFNTLGIKFIMDLRTAKEEAARPDPFIPGAKVIRHSGLEMANGHEIDFSPTGMGKVGKEGYEQLDLLTGYYTAIPFNNQAFQILMKNLLEENVPLLFHCHTGKDRTGVFAMILLLALGVDRETVFKDYILSNEYHREALETALLNNKEKFVTNPEAKELLTMFHGVSETIGKKVLDSIFTKDGSLENYFLMEFGLNQDDINRLRDFYLE